MRPTIRVGAYHWERGVPIPKCDSCAEKDAEWKVYTTEVGIRLCDMCLKELKKRIPEFKEI